MSSDSKDASVEENGVGGRALGVAGALPAEAGNSSCSKGRSLDSVKDPGYSMVPCKCKSFLLLKLLSSAAVYITPLVNWQDSWPKAAAFPLGGPTDGLLC